MSQEAVPNGILLSVYLSAVHIIGGALIWGVVGCVVLDHALLFWLYCYFFNGKARSMLAI